MKASLLKVFDRNGNPITAVGFHGVSPHIGKNGNWWIGDKDTGVKANGGISEEDKEEIARQAAELLELDELRQSVTDLEQSLDDLLYEEIDILSFGNNVNTAEMGSTVDTLVLSWTLNKDAVKTTINGTEVTGKSKTYTNAGITVNTSWNLVVTDEREKTDSANTRITFCNRICYGVATEGVYDSAFISSLSSQILSDARGRNITVVANEGEHIFYALPSRLGTPNFNVGGFDGGFTKVASRVVHTNASNYTESYDVWMSDNENLGSTTVKIT